MIVREIIFDLQRFDDFFNQNDNVLVSGTGDDDFIDNAGENVTVKAAEGNDEIDNNGPYSLVDGGADDDIINNYGQYSTVLGGAGNDYIVNTWTASGYYSSLNGGAGDDTIDAQGYGHTVSGGTGDDSINGVGSSGGIYVYGGGNDTINNFGQGASFIVIENYKWERTDPGISAGDSGTFKIINVLDDKDSVVGTITYASWDRVCNIVSSLDEVPEVNPIIYPFYETEDNSLIQGTSGRDEIVIGENTNVTVDAGAGDDYIRSDNGGSYESISCGTGNDTVLLWFPKRVTVDGGDGDDFVESWADNVTFTGGKGNDSLFGAGKTLILYNNGDGNDYIEGFDSSSRLSISGAAYSTQKSGDDLIVTVGNGKITLAGAAGSNPRIIGTLGGGSSEDTTPAEDPKLLTVTDSTSSPVTIASTVETVDASARTKDVKINGNSKANSIVGGSGKDTINGGAGKDTLQGGKGDDVLTGGSGADIFLYKSGDGNDVITDYAEEDKISILSGAASFSTSDDDVIFTVGKSKITVTGGAGKKISYVDKNGEQVFFESQDATEINGKSIILTENYFDSSFNLADYDKKIQTVDASAVQFDISITGNKLANKITGSSQDDTIDGGAGADYLLGGKGADSIFGGTGDDTLEGGTGNDNLTGGKGADIFVYNKGDGKDVITDYAEEDTIQINSDKVSKVSKSGSNIVFTLASKGKITITGGTDKVITYVDSDGEHTYPETVKFNAKGTAAVLTSAYSKDDFNIADYDDYKNSVVTINAAAVNHDISITANKLANKILGSDENDTIDGGAGADSINGGKGADTLVGGTGDDTLIGGVGNDVLTGGKGADIFVYNKGDGKDTITDYAEEDIIQINSDTVNKISANKDNIVFTLTSKGKITITGGVDKVITYVDADGEHTYPEEESVQFNKKGTSAVLTSAYSEDTFNISDYDKYKNSVVTIDASAVNHDINITGNKLANKIIGSSQDDSINGGNGSDTVLGGAGNDSLVGGKGNDNLTGGAGSDMFIYNNGDGNDVIADFTNEDKILIASGKPGKVAVKNSDVIFKIGSGKITVENGADKFIQFYDAEGNALSTSYTPSNFLEDDEAVLTVDNISLSQIVENKSYSALGTLDTTLNLTAYKNYISVITQSNKK